MVLKVKPTVKEPTKESLFIACSFMKPVDSSRVLKEPELVIFDFETLKEPEMAVL
jgi:hypothetical protein